MQVYNFYKYGSIYFKGEMGQVQNGRLYLNGTDEAVLLQL